MYPSLWSCTDQQFAGDFAITGWGLTRTGLPSILQKVILSKIDDRNCRGLNKPFEFCAGKIANRSTCLYDSGGPAVVRARNGLFIQVGVVSGGTGVCGAVDKNTYFMFVSAYVDWIRKNTVIYGLGSQLN